MIRAKFRCMSVTTRIKDSEANLLPVIAKNEQWPDGSEENAAFWSATPAGSLTIRYVSPDACDLEPGAYYYIDLERTNEPENLPWKLWKVARTEHAVEVKLGMAWDTRREKIMSAELEMTIRNDRTWPDFEGHVASSWRVMLSRADGHHEGCPCTG